MMALDMQTHSYCRLTASDPIPYMDYYSAALPQGSRHNWIINHEQHKHFTSIFRNLSHFFSFQYLWENGLLNYWLKTYTPNVDKCMMHKTKHSGRISAFTLGDLSSAFTFLSIGIGLSVLGFFLEMISTWMKFRKRYFCRVIL